MTSYPRRFEASTVKEFLESCRGLMPQLNIYLSMIIKGREDKFLQLGESLQEFYVSAQELSSMAAALAESTFAESMAGFIRQLGTEIEEVRRVIGLFTRSRNIEELSGIQRTVESMEKLVDSFKRVVRGLQMLGVSTRIESSRLGRHGGGFITLADDVEALAANIVTYSAGIMDKSGALEKQVADALDRTNKLKEDQDRHSSDIFSELADNLDHLTLLVDRSKELSEKIGNKSKGVAQSTGEAVSSIQFHDIIRQQVEHVEESLADIISLLDEGRGAPDQSETEIRDFIGWIGDVCYLQGSQLSNASNRFVSAVENLKTHLRLISEHSMETCGYCREIIGADDKEGGTVLQSVTTGMDKVIASIHEFSDQGERIGGIMTAVAETVAETSSFLENIEEVGDEIDLISLNASVKAAHTGDKGKALGVLASSIQKLSSEAQTLTASITGVLSDISTSSDVLKKDAAKFLEGSSIQEMVSRLSGLISDLNETNLEMLEVIDKMQIIGERLASAIDRMVQGVDFHLAVGGELDKAEEVLREVVSKARTLVPEDQDENRPERLKKMLERYTMEVERVVHESMYEQAGSVSDGEGSIQAGQDDDMGDVELF